MGGKRMILPKEAMTKIKGKKHPFTAGHALVDVGTAKHVDA